VAIITPWYPTFEMPFRGAFVQAMVDATAPGCDQTTVYHLDDWYMRTSPKRAKVIAAAHREVLSQSLRRGGTTAGAGLMYIPVPVQAGTTFAGVARLHDEWLRAALGGRPLDEPVVHAHVGYGAGWAALGNAAPDAKVFITEHATFLDRVLAEPDGKAMYDEMLERCTGFFTVGDAARDELARVFPHRADRIGVIPNPVSFDAPRRRPVTELRRWLFVGGLIPRKGVDLLLEAFARCRADDARLTLTLVGEGELAVALGQRVAALGLTDAVTFTGAVTPPQALSLMLEHDLLVHPSRRETFGMTVVEAIAAGMPVLVTRCGGPEETLAGIERAAGELIDVTRDPGTIVAGYRRLRERFPHDVDLARAREHLAAQYGYPAVAATHHGCWFETDDRVAVGPGLERVE
jgi:glycogen(starch) synthase